MAMRDILFPECVITHMKAKSKEDALHQLYEVLLKNGKVMLIMVKLWKCLMALQKYVICQTVSLPD